MMRLSRTVVSTFMTAAVLGGISDSFAYRMIQNTGVGRVTSGDVVQCSDAGGFTHWTKNDIDWYHNTALQGSGKAAALQAAMSSWTNVAWPSHVLNYAGTLGAGFATDGANTVVWANGNGCTGNCLALTALVLSAGQVIYESDITFNNAATWTTDGSDYDTESVAAHEFGHTLGLHHTEISSSPLPTMRSTYFGSGARSLETDDQDALVCSETRYPFPLVVSVDVVNSCQEVHAVVYTRTTGATSYKIWRSDTGSSYYEIYSGAHSSPVYVDVPSGSIPDYIKAQGCDAGVCGAFSNVVSLSWQGSCS